MVSIFLNSWVIYAFFKSRSLTFKSDLLLLSLCRASLTKSILTWFIFAGTSALAGWYSRNSTSLYIIILGTIVKLHNFQVGFWSFNVSFIRFFTTNFRSISNNDFHYYICGNVPIISTSKKDVQSDFNRKKIVNLSLIKNRLQTISNFQEMIFLYGFM